FGTRFATVEKSADRTMLMLGTYAHVTGELIHCSPGAYFTRQPASSLVDAGNFALSRLRRPLCIRMSRCRHRLISVLEASLTGGSYALPCCISNAIAHSLCHAANLYLPGVRGAVFPYSGTAVVISSTIHGQPDHQT